MQIDFDPAVISYEELLGYFWRLHKPTSPPWKRQYMSAILSHDDEQNNLATASIANTSHEWDSEIFTELAPMRGFTWAEDYHQKYRLQRHKALSRTLQERFVSFADFVNAPVVTRLNAYVAGYGLPEDPTSFVQELQLSSQMEADLLAALRTVSRRSL